MTDKKRNRGSWFLFTKTGKDVEEFQTVKELRTRLGKLKDGDLIALIKGQRHQVEKKTIEQVAIS